MVVSAFRRCIFVRRLCYIFHVRFMSQVYMLNVLYFFVVVVAVAQLTHVYVK